MNLQKVTAVPRRCPRLPGTIFRPISLLPPDSWTEFRVDFGRPLALGDEFWVRSSTTHDPSKCAVLEQCRVDIFIGPNSWGVRQYWTDIKVGHGFGYISQFPIELTFKPVCWCPVDFQVTSGNTLNTVFVLRSVDC